MRWLVYNLIFTVVYVLLLPKWLLHMRRRGGYRKGFLQRLGLYDAEVTRRLQEKRRIWVHAVSVGEVLVALRYMKDLRAVLPGASFVLTTNTSTGHGLAAKKLPAEDVLLYFPTDFPWIVRRVFRLIRPVALILTECELWPNLIRHSRRLGTPVMVINGRISASSHRGYRVMRWVFKPIVRSINLFLVQTGRDREMLAELGALPESVHVLGTAKYDVAEADGSGWERARGILRSMGIPDDATILLGGSTWPGEERILLEQYVRLARDFPGLKLILAPRHAERGDEVAQEIRSRGLSFVRRRMMVEGGKIAPSNILLLDTTGELKDFYACASVVFVGKSLTAQGGQNPIEPALYGKPVVVGPNMQNFPEVVADFLEADAILQVSGEAGLGETLAMLVSDREHREAFGRRAAELVQRKKGTVRTSVELMRRYLEPGRNGGL